MGEHYSEGMKKRECYELEEILEGLVDRHGIDELITMLGGICEGKAHHMKEVWRDNEEFEFWKKRCCQLWNV